MFDYQGRTCSLFGKPIIEKPQLLNRVRSKVLHEVYFLRCSVVAERALVRFLSQMGAKVSLEASFLRRSVVAVRALVRFLTRMCSNVFTEVASIARSVFAPRTSVRLLARMRPKVPIQDAFMRRPVSAVFVCACVWFHACMPSNVIHEGALLRCAVITVRATVRLRSGVYPKMLGEGALSSSAITALPTLKRFGASMRSYMSVQVGFARRVVVAIIAGVFL